MQNKVNESMGNDERYELNERNIEILAERVIKGEFGDEEQQKKEFGDNYEKIQKKICQIKGIDKNLTIEELSNKVIKGELGNNDERKNKLGEFYPIVQNRVNEIVGSDVRLDIDENCLQILAARVIKGEFGDGELEKKSNIF